MNLDFSHIETLVVKIGTSLLTGPKGFDGRVMEAVVKEVSALKASRKLNVLLVSSGAMGCGMELLGLSSRPHLLPLKQATAAMGQSRLMHYYEVLFQTYGDGLNTAQILLSAADLDDRQSYLNVRNTINALFAFGNVVPIVNENDSTATEEIRFGDNDTLAAKIAVKINADLLIILSDVDGLYDANPEMSSDAKLIESVERVTPELEACAEDTRAATSIGGMRTKLEAGKIACTTGLPMVIANGHREHVVQEVLEGKGRMTVFRSSNSTLSPRKRWIAFGRAPRGSVLVDDGAKKALLQDGRSLLPAGVLSIDGSFDIGEAVKVKDSTGRELARGLTNYSDKEIACIKGCKTKDIAELLGYKDFDEIIHRDNLVIL